MMTDDVYLAFLARQLENAMAFAASCALLDLVPGPGPTPDRYVATFRCRTLTRTPEGELGETDRSRVGIWLPPEYLRLVNQFEILSWLGPGDAWHPNIAASPSGRGTICIGTIAPATPLVEILDRIHEVIRFENVTFCEANSLNPAACAWARKQDCFPTDDRSLAGTVGHVDVDIEDMATDEEPRT